MEVPQEMLGRYVERRKKDLELCLINLERQNFKELERVGHQLKGNGVTFGFTELSEIGEHLECGALKKNRDQMERALEDLSIWLARNSN
jgi:HPt (histidine-containing phosphotransfer) domain-containing protein